MVLDAVVGGIGGGVGHTSQAGVQTAKGAQIRELESQVARQEKSLARPSRTSPEKRSATRKMEAAKAGIQQAERQASTTGTVVGTTTTNAAAPIVVEKLIPEKPKGEPGR